MINGMYLSTMGAMVQSSRHAVTANNLANVNTGGFKPDWAVYKAMPAESVLQPGHRSEIDAILEKTGGGVWLDSTVTDFRPGIMRQTGAPLDIALRDGDGEHVSFFMTREPGSDEMRYTRNGHLTVNSDDELVNDAGNLILGPDGGPITLPRSIEVQINDDGNIYDKSNGELIAQIGVVRTSDKTQMRKIGESLYQNDGATLENYQAGVASGYIEDSSTNSINEMASMIEGHRAYEANMTFLRAQDETLSEVVRRLGAVS